MTTGSSGLAASSERASHLRGSVPAICIAIVVLVPFLFSAYTIDDVTFLLQAKHAVLDPLHPTAFDMVFHGSRIRLSEYLVTGPVMAYLLVPSILLIHGEWVAHLTQIALLILAVIGTSRLSMRLGLDQMQATAACIILVVSPAVLGMTITAMPDIAAMTFAVSGIDRLLEWAETRTPVTAVYAGALLGIAALSRPHLILIFGCGALLVLLPLQKKDRAPAQSLSVSVGAPIAIAILIWLGVVWITRDPQSGKSVAAATLSRFSIMRVTFNLLSFPLACVTAFPLGFLWPFLRGRAFISLRRTCVAFTLAIVLGVNGGFFIFPTWMAVLALVLAAHGLDVLFDILIDGFRRRDYTQLALAVWVLIALSAIFYVQLPPKDLVPSAPAMAILLARRIGFGKSLLRIPAMLGVVVASLVLGVLILRASASLGEVGRQGGRMTAAQVKSGQRVWADGGWGFQWYAMEAGALPLADTPPFPSAGDVLVAGLKARLVQRYANREPVSLPLLFDTPGGRVETSGAGFFSNLHGLLPWVWSSDELGRIEVWRVVAATSGGK